jgi:hypothetical protein
MKSAAQTEDALSVLDVAEVGLADGEDYELGAGQVEAARFKGGEDAVVVACRVRTPSSLPA